MPSLCKLHWSQWDKDSAKTWSFAIERQVWKSTVVLADLNLEMGRTFCHSTLIAVGLLACLAKELPSSAAGERHYRKLPGTADYELISAYEDLVTTVTNNRPLGLQDLPKRLILFSVWYIASRSLHSALAGGGSSCEGEYPESFKPYIRTRICKLDPSSVELVSPFLFGENVPSPELTAAELWAHVAKRALYLSEISRTYTGVITESSFQASMLSLSQLAASLPELLESNFGSILRNRLAVAVSWLERTRLSAA